MSRHLLITGASRGIGAAVVEAGLQGGFVVSACARTAGPGIAAVDVTDAGAVATWMASAVARHGPIDLFINNAAILGPRVPIEVYPEADFRAVLETNVIGAFLVAKAAVPLLRRPGAVMLHVSSWVGRHGLPRYGAYSVSKFAIEGLARVLAEELRDDGVISCALDPGMVQTDMLRASLGTTDVSEYAEPRQVAARTLALAAAVTLEQSGTTLDCR